MGLEDEKGRQRTVFDDPVAMARLGRLFARGRARRLAREAREAAEKVADEPGPE